MLLTPGECRPGTLLNTPHSAQDTPHQRLVQPQASDMPRLAKSDFTHSRSVQFSRSVVSNSSRPHELQHARPPCPSPTPTVPPNPCPSSQCCHPTTSSSVIPFSSRLQSFPASGSFPVSKFFASGGQRIGVSASTSVLPMNTQD